MKISASIYSDKGNDILQTIKDLNESMVDYIHVDCNDNLNVFVDIQTIQQNSHIPIDLHIITEDAKRFYPALIEFDIEYVTFQYEDLKDKKLQIPKEFSGQLGLAITSDTSVTVFENYKEDSTQDEVQEALRELTYAADFLERGLHRGSRGRGASSIRNAVAHGKKGSDETN